MSQQGNGGRPSAPPAGAGNPSRAPLPAAPAGPATPRAPIVPATTAARAPMPPIPQVSEPEVETYYPPVQTQSVRLNPGNQALPTGPGGQGGGRPLPGRPRETQQPAPSQNPGSFQRQESYTSQAPPASATEYYENTRSFQPAPFMPNIGSSTGQSQVWEEENDPSVSSGKGKRKSRKTSSLAGGRVWVVVARIGIVAFVGLLSILGLVSVLMPGDTSVQDQLSQEVRDVAFDGFPISAARSYATEFVNAYLTITPETEQERAQTLTLLAPNVSASGMALNPVPFQEVIEGPFEYTSPYFESRNTVSLYMKALVKTAPDQTPGGATWMYLAIPLYADDLGNVTLSSLPSFVPAPPTVALGPPAVAASDDTVFVSEVRAFVNDFFGFWAASDEVSLSRMLLDDTIQGETRAGLNSAVTLASLDSISSPAVAPGTTMRRVDTIINWTLPSGAISSQAYSIWLQQNPAAEWRVIQVAPNNILRIPESVNTGS